VGSDVFDKHEGGANFRDDAGKVRPKITGVSEALPFSGLAVALARISPSEQIHDATPRSAIKSLGI
jgi:hypothetical protein